VFWAKCRFSAGTLLPPLLAISRRLSSLIEAKPRFGGLSSAPMTVLRNPLALNRERLVMVEVRALRELIWICRRRAPGRWHRLRCCGHCNPESLRRGVPQQIAAISTSKALPHALADHRTGGLPSTGAICAVRGTKRGEAIPGESDGKIIERGRKDETNPKKGQLTPRSRPARNGAAPETRVRSSILRRSARTTQASPHSLSPPH
jgi:hypothetical protein